MVGINNTTARLISKEYRVAEPKVGDNLRQFSGVLEQNANKTKIPYASKANNKILLAVPGNATGVLAEALDKAFKDRTSRHYIVSNEGGQALVIPIMESDFERLAPPSTIQP